MCLVNSPICIIPARGGSKRIPRKNTRLFKGIPCLQRAINLAREVNVFDKIFVSTDDPEIANMAKALDVSVISRRESQLSSDYATTREVMQDAVIQLDLGHRQPVCCLYPVTPLLKCEPVVKAYEILIDGNFDYVFPVQRFSSSVYRAMKINTFGELENLFPQFELSRTQDLPTTFFDAGQFYWGECKSWKDATSIFSKKSRIIELPFDQAVDIDSEDDWEKAELLFEYRQR